MFPKMLLTLSGQSMVSGVARTSRPNGSAGHDHTFDEMAPLEINTNIQWPTFNNKKPYLKIQQPYSKTENFSIKFFRNRGVA